MEFMEILRIILVPLFFTLLSAGLNFLAPAAENAKEKEENADLPQVEAAEDIAEAAADEAAEEIAETPETDGKAEEKPGRFDKKYLFYLLAEYAGNVLAAYFICIFYKCGLFDLLNVELILSVLWACAWVDRKCFVIPNKIILVGLLLRAALIAVECISAPNNAGYVLLSSAIAAVALLIASLLCRLVSKDAIGFGDIKLLMLMGLCLKNDRIWGAVFATMVIAFFYSIGLLIFKKATKKTEIPFAPLLLIGTLTATVIFTL